MILSASIVYIGDQPVLLCKVGTPKHAQMAHLEEAFQSYEKQRIPGARLILLHAADPRDAAKAALRLDLLRRFGTVAVFHAEEHGFRVIHTRMGSAYKKYDVIQRNRLVVHPPQNGPGKKP